MTINIDPNRSSSHYVAIRKIVKNVRSIKLITTGVIILFSNALFALECEDASEKAFGAFESISIDESTRKVNLSSYTSENVFPELELIEGPGDDKTYHFNQYFTEKKGTRFFKLFYIEVWDEWRMIDSVVLEKSGIPSLVGVSGSVKYKCV